MGKRNAQLWCWLLGCATALPSILASPPHIFTLLVDDLGWGNVGYHREDAGLPATPEVVTPHIDALARSGIDLSRHYGFKSCSPSRCSFQSGRLPVHVLDANTIPESYNSNDTVSGYAGIPTKMTTIAHKLKAAGFATHFVGKWDVGMATPTHTPKGRGYDTGLSYFHHSNDYYTENGDGTMCRGVIDIWGTDRPAANFNTSASNEKNQRNGTLVDFEEYKFMKHVQGIIQHHPVSQPLFVTYATHLVHEPLQVPTIYLQRLESIIQDNENRLLYHSMVSCLDDVVGNITFTLNNSKLWDDTLFVFSSDNGGPSFNSAHTANNYPLRGSKLSDWEGGIRVTAFVAGGWVTAAGQSRTRRDGLISIADWYATFCELAGQNASDTAAAAANLPPIDSISMVSYLRGNSNASPRIELQPDSNVLLKEVRGTTDGGTGSQIYKLFGSDYPGTPQGSTGWACFPGPHYPNATDPSCNASGNCDRELGGCLFELVSDPTEHFDVASQQHTIMKSMVSRLGKLQSALFSPDRGKADQQACIAAHELYGGFYGPWLQLNTSW